MRFLGITSEKNGLHDLEMVVIIGHEKGIYPLVMTNSLPWKITMLLIGKPSISMGHYGPFSMAMLNKQRVYIYMYKPWDNV